MAKVNIQSFRHVNRNLPQLLSSNMKWYKSIELKHDCCRMCYYDNCLYDPSYRDNIINVHSMSGQLLKTIPCEQVNGPKSLHPYKSNDFMLAAESGLYVIDVTQRDKPTQILQGNFQDVHISSNMIVALEIKNDDCDFDQIHFLHATDPPTKANSFVLNHANANSVMLHNGCVYVSASGYHSSITMYTYTGDLLAQYGKRGGGAEGELNYPLLCGSDTKGNIFIADSINNRLQILSKSGEFSVVKGVKLMNPWDVVIVGNDLYVLHEDDSGNLIVNYQLTK